jgi:uncharacterized protein (TIGR03083 family)
MDATTVLAAASSAFEATADSLTALVRALPDTRAPIPDSQWSVREATVHLVNDARLYTELASGAPSPIPTMQKKKHEVYIAHLLADIAEDDPMVLGDLMTGSAEKFLAATAGRPGDQEVIFHADLRFDLAHLMCVALGEELIHGYDIARAVGRPWPIDPGHALLVLYGYGPTYPLCVHPQTTAGLNAAYGIELRGADAFTIRFVDGEYSVEPPNSGPVDCTISADPVAFLLVGTGRLSQWEAIALGLLTGGGPKPELALGFNDLFVYP